MRSIYFIYNIICLLISSSSIFISGTNICKNKSPCKCILSSGPVIDLSSVGRVDHPRFYEIRSGNENDTKLYSYNPCYGFDTLDYVDIKPGYKPCKGAAGCVRTPGTIDGHPPEEYMIGLQSEGTFGRTKELNDHINYTVPGGTQRLMVLLNCTNATDSLTILPPESDDRLLVMRLNSKCACENGCVSADPVSSDEGLSTGSKLLIAFFTILMAYFVIGLVWNFCNGAHGSELIPNYDFWNDLPKLIIEGLIFTCTCFGFRSTYGEV